VVRNKLKVAGIGVTSVALLVAGLGAAPATAAKSSLVVENVFQLTSTDPARSFEQTGNMINHALYETLITYKGGDASQPVPAIASKWRYNSNATSFSFTIDPKAKFSDGTRSHRQT